MTTAPATIHARQRQLIDMVKTLALLGKREIVAPGARQLGAC